MRRWSELTELTKVVLVGWIGVARGKFFDWQRRYGRANGHNSSIPRDHWLESSERHAIIEYFKSHPLDGCRLAFMMIDDDVAAVSPATVVAPSCTGKSARP